MSIRDQKVFVLGDSNVGKSALVIQFVYNEFLDTYPKQEGVASKFLTFEENQHILSIRDPFPLGTHHDEEISQMYHDMTQTDSLLFLFSVTDRNSFLNVAEHIKNAKEVCELQRISQIPCVLVATKLDLIEERVVSREEAEKYAESNKIMYMESSSKTRTGVDEIFYELLTQMNCGEKYQKPEPKTDPNINGSCLVQ